MSTKTMTVVNRDKLGEILGGDPTHEGKVKQALYRINVDADQTRGMQEEYARDKYIARHFSGDSAPDLTVLNGSYESVRVVEALPPEDPDNAEYVWDGQYLEEGDEIGIEVTTDQDVTHQVLRAGVHHAREPHPSSVDHEPTDSRYLLTRDADGSTTFRLHGPYEHEESLRAAYNMADLINDSNFSVVGKVSASDIENQMDRGVEYVRAVLNSDERHADASVVLDDEPQDDQLEDRKLHVHNPDGSVDEVTVDGIREDVDVESGSESSREEQSSMGM